MRKKLNGVKILKTLDRNANNVGDRKQKDLTRDKRRG